MADHCSEWARDQGVDPVGTAGSYNGYLLVEWPLPWPRDVSEIVELTAVHEALRGTGIRLQAIAPISAPTRRHVVLYRRAAGSAAGSLARTELTVDGGDLVAAALDLLAGTAPASTHDATAVTTDLLICGHGRRDRCCGSLGTALSLAIATEPDALGTGVRVWRTSHTGGHRFAPTAIVLPEATAWAFADVDALARIVARHGALDDLLPRFRGCSGLGSGALQALDRAVLEAVGWDWLDHDRLGEDLGDGRVALTGARRGASSRWEAVVSVARHSLVPDCGKPIATARKTEAELVVSHLARVA